MKFTALTWNLFHGRDFPPDPALRTWRSRLLRLSEANGTHKQVNRGLFDEFAGTLARASWDVALLQECPPRWTAKLAARTGSVARRSLTSRNSCPAVRSALAGLNPDLIASNEGGSNAILVRGEILESRELELCGGPRPERRTMVFARARLGAGAGSKGVDVCVANLHASAGAEWQALAAEQIVRAATSATEWARGEPLVFGGDLNLRPERAPVYDVLAERFGLRGITAPDAIDHLLATGLEPHGPPRRWPAADREVREGGLAIRLSDHAPVSADLEAPATA